MRNKYAGKCFVCGADVPSGAGYFQRMNGGWSCRCRGCVGAGNKALAPLKYGIGSGDENGAKS